MTEFKVGDRVRLVTDGGFGPDEPYVVGAEGEVVGAGEHDLPRVLVDGETEHIHGLYFFDHEIELIEEEEATDAPEDIVSKPSHYARWVIEPIAFIMRNGFEFWRGNIVKYASRAGFKKYEGKTMEESEVIDLEKVIRYAEMRINQLKGETVL